MKKTVWALQAALFYIFTLLAALIPAALTYRAGALAGLLITTLVPKRRTVALENIRLALPFMKAHPLWNHAIEDAEGLTRETFINLGCSLIEVCRLYHGRGEELIRNIKLVGVENYDAARARGKGIIFLTGHCGNWELLALAFPSIFKGQMAVIARRQNNPYLNRMVEKMRMKYNNRVIYKQGSLKSMLSTLKKNGIVGLLADQAGFPEDAVLVDMLGRKAWALKAPVIIARMSGASLVPAFIHREGAHHVITFHPEHLFSEDRSDIGTALETQALSRYVENYVIAHPAQWYWVHRRWKRAGEMSQ